MRVTARDESTAPRREICWQLLLLPFSSTYSIPLPSCAVFVLRIGLCEVQHGFHDGPVLDEEFPHIPGSAPASFLTSKEYDGSSTPKIFRFLVIFICVWGRDWV